MTNYHGTGPSDCDCPICGYERTAADGWAKERELRLVREARERVREYLERECSFQHEIDPAPRVCTVFNDSHYNCRPDCPACKWLTEQVRHVSAIQHRDTAEQLEFLW